MPSPCQVSVIITVWNNKAYLSTCLENLVAQTIQDFEVVLIDNGSNDGSTEGLEERFPRLDMHIKRLEENLGFAVANNVGARFASGKWLALLNTDAYPEPDWLETLLLTAEQNPGYSLFASRQVQFNDPDLLDGAGDAYHISGLAWRNSYNLSSKKNELEQKEVFSTCAAAALYSREEFLNAGGFDEDYFSYFEDVDLGFRLRLEGAKCLYVPDAVVRHVGSASTGKRSSFSVYYGYRNLIWTFFKDMPFPLILIFLPVHILTILFFALYLSLRGQGKAIWMAIFDAMRGLPRMIEKRKVIQRNRRIKPTRLLQVISTGFLDPYREFIKRNKPK